MKLMLASLDVVVWSYVEDIAHLSKYVLLSYWYLEKRLSNQKLVDIMIERNATDDFMLDSGAFTMIQGNMDIDLDEYIERYIEFVKKYKIKRYIELDIDSVIGYDKVKEIRARLEREVGWQCVPVWHKNRGIEDYKQMVDEYEYIAFGGFNDAGDLSMKSEDYPLIKQMIQYANHRGVKVHGLGFTREECVEFGFYSVDSASWRAGSRFGRAFKFEDGYVKSYGKPRGMLVNYETVDRNNFIEWCKYQRSVEREYTLLTGIRCNEFASYPQK